MSHESPCSLHYHIHMNKTDVRNQLYVPWQDSRDQGLGRTANSPTTEVRIAGAVQFVEKVVETLPRELKSSEAIPVLTFWLLDSLLAPS